MFLKIKLKTSSTLESIDPMAAQLKMFLKIKVKTPCALESTVTYPQRF